MMWLLSDRGRLEERRGARSRTGSKGMPFRRLFRGDRAKAPTLEPSTAIGGDGLREKSWHFSSMRSRRRSRGGDMESGNGSSRSRSEDAWRALVDRFAPLVHGVARSFRLPRDEAEDVSQTVWLRLFEHLERLRDPDRVGAWLASTTPHECLARCGSQDAAGRIDDAGFPEPVDAEPVDARLLRVERDARLQGDLRPSRRPLRSTRSSRDGRSRAELRAGHRGGRNLDRERRGRSARAAWPGCRTLCRSNNEFFGEIVVRIRPSGERRRCGRGSRPGSRSARR